MSSSLQTLLEELQKNYLASFTEKTMNLEHLWKASRIDELTTEYHKLKGTGRTYGLPEVTILGEVLEAICEQGAELKDDAKLAEALATAVPLSQKLLERIRVSRAELGEEFVLENDSDFLALLALLPKKKPGPPPGRPGKP